MKEQSFHIRFTMYFFLEIQRLFVFVALSAKKILSPLSKNEGWVHPGKVTSSSQGSALVIPIKFNYAFIYVCIFSFFLFFVNQIH